MAWLMRLLLRLPASGGQAALAQCAMGVRFAKILEAHWKYRGYLEKPRREKSFPSFGNHGSELGISRPRISRVSRVLAPLAAWEAEILPLNHARNARSIIRQAPVVPAAFRPFQQTPTTVRGDCPSAARPLAPAQSLAPMQPLLAPQPPASGRLTPSGRRRPAQPGTPEARWAPT